MTHPYLDTIIDHGQHPRQFGEPLVRPDIDARDENPLCGDWLRLTARLDDQGRIAALSWQGDGCTICLASASLLGESLLGQPVETVRALSKTDILAMLGIELSPTRLKCALLSLRVVQAGVQSLGSRAGDYRPQDSD